MEKRYGIDGKKEMVKRKKEVVKMEKIYGKDRKNIW